MSSDKLETMRHSASHLLAAAVMELWPQTKLAIGPAIEEGFYYDFDFVSPISDTDLPKIGVKIEEIKTKNLPFTKKEVLAEEAKRIFSNQSYKQELIDELAKVEGVKLTKGWHNSNKRKVFKNLQLVYSP